VSDERTSYEFSAENFCRAWLSVFTATADDDARPIMHRTIAMEMWPQGIRLTACDSYMIWTSFVPSFGRDIDDAPAFGELPDEEQIVVACDEDHRTRDLLKFAFKTVTAKDAPPQHLKVSFGPAPLDDGQFPGTEREQVAFSFPADAPVGERVVLRAVEGHYPEWRSLMVASPKSTKEIRLNSELLTRVASVKRYYGDTMHFTFSGAQKAVMVEPVRPAEGPIGPSLLGAVMPIRVGGDSV
jgi:hypothetical protein